ncbi:MAG: aspartate aminotransferase family protein [Gemmatimonadota bacterium]|nr:MAG: aspartate aminotransferase family protein [Gemmatimonadota bacterium]
MTDTGCDDRALEDIEAAHASGGVARREATIVRGQGARIFDQQGMSYIDLSAGHGWAGLGHAHPAVTQAIREQAEKLVCLTESAFNDQRALWLSELTALLQLELGSTGRGPLTRVNISNSGSEAIEAAIKLARLFTGRSEIVSFRRGFHGRTLGALSATARQTFRQPFEPLVPGFSHLPYNDLAALAVGITERTAAVIVEVVQGEGGVHIARPEFAQALRDACDRAGALLVIDEIQTGLGRTGRWFASQHFDLAPDILALGKTLGGGVPMGATIWREALGTIPAGSHGSTFGGGPLACAASRAVLEVIREEDLPQRAARLGRLLLERLAGSDARVVRQVRGLGLMLGVELRTKVTPILRRLMQRGVWALPAGMNVLRLLPPLTISESELDNAVTAVEEVLRDA